MNKPKFKTDREVFDQVKPVAQNVWMEWAEQNQAPRLDLETLNELSKFLLEKGVSNEED
jgi:hypothetical protein